MIMILFATLARPQLQESSPNNLQQMRARANWQQVRAQITHCLPIHLALLSPETRMNDSQDQTKLTIATCHLSLVLLLASLAGRLAGGRKMKREKRRHRCAPPAHSALQLGALIARAPCRLKASERTSGRAAVILGQTTHLFGVGTTWRLKSRPSCVPVSLAGRPAGWLAGWPACLLARPAGSGQPPGQSNEA